VKKKREGCLKSGKIQETFKRREEMSVKEDKYLDFLRKVFNWKKYKEED